MRTGDLGKHFLSAKFDKLNKTAKTVRESKMNESPETDQYAKPINRHLVKMDNMQYKLRQAALNISKMDDGDLTDQVTTMLKLLDKFDEVMQRSFAIIPEGTEIEEATPTSEFDYDIKKFFAKVQELEDENQHGEVAKMLTQLYGTNAEAMIINGINAMHANEGSIGPEAQKLRDKISTKYYYQAQKEAGGEKFPANTSATQGKRMGAESIGERITAPVKPPKLTAPADTSKPIKRPNAPKSSWAQVLDPVGSGKKKKKIGEARTNMFGIQVRDIDDKIKDTETQIELAKSNRGGWKEKDIPKLESKLAHLKMKKAKGVTEEAEKNAYVCVHAKKGKHECHATSSYGAAKKAAAHWGLKSTAGIDAHLAVDEGVPGMEPEQKICCKHCGDELYGEPKTDCGYDINNPDQDNWILVDVDGDGDPDMKISYEPMPEGWMDDAKNAVGSTLRKVTDKVKDDYKQRKQLFGKGKL